jgi:hypothetical protein
VVLPLPVGPTTATTSPAATSKSTSRSAGSRPGYANVRPANRMDGGSSSGAPGGAPGGAASTISWIRAMDVSPRRTTDSVSPSATVGHARYAR